MAGDWQKRLESAAKHIAAHDPYLAPIIGAHGPCRITPHDNYYQALVDAIISQQLSMKAAASIEARFQALFDGRFPTANEILRKDIDTLRSVGLSRSKAVYILDLAEHIRSGRLDITALPSLSNDEIVRELVAIKGIGEWTAHMFLIFSLGRLDVLPVGDLGVRTGIMRLYGLKTLPTAVEMKAIANKYTWHPYTSIASWYIWQSLENAPAI